MRVRLTPSAQQNETYHFNLLVKATTTERLHNYSIDLLRIIAGIAVVIIHTTDAFVNRVNLYGGSTWWLSNILNSYSRIAVPLFIMISGYLLLDKKITSFSDFYRRRFTRILIPFIFWIIMYFLILEYKYFSPQHIVDALIKGSVGPYYFLFVISGLYLIVSFLQLIINTFSKRTLTIVVVALFCHVALLYFCNRIVENTVSFSSSLTLFIPYIGYFLVGGFFKKYKISKKYRYRRLIGFIVLGLCVAVLNYMTAVFEIKKIVVLNTFMWNQYFYEPFNPMMILMSILLFTFILSLNFRFNSIQKKILSTLSSAIFGVFLAHPFVITLLNIYFHLDIDHLLSPLWFYLIIKILITLALSFIIVLIGKKTPILKHIFG